MTNKLNWKLQLEQACMKDVDSVYVIDTIIPAVEKILDQQREEIIKEFRDLITEEIIIHIRPIHPSEEGSYARSWDRFVNKVIKLS